MQLFSEFRRLSGRWSGAGACLSFMLEGAEIRAQVIDVSEGGVQIGLGSDLELSENQVLDATLVWRRLRVEGRFEVRYLDDSVSQGFLAGGTFVPKDAAVFTTFVATVSGKIHSGGWAIEGE